MGPRSDFSKPCQGAAEKSANATRCCCLACGSQWLGMSTVEAVNRKISWLFCFVSHGCTVFARSVLSMSDDVGRCIALQSVPFFASGEQGQAQFCLHFRVGILEQFQKSRHGDGGFACGGYSLRAGSVGLGIEAAFKLLAQLHTGGLLDMGVGVHQHIRTGVSCGSLHRLDVTAGDHQLVGGTGMPQTVKDDAGKLRVCIESITQSAKFLAKSKRLLQRGYVLCYNCFTALKRRNLKNGNSRSASCVCRFCAWNI